MKIKDDYVDFLRGLSQSLRGQPHKPCFYSARDTIRVSAKNPEYAWESPEGVELELDAAVKEEGLSTHCKDKEGALIALGWKKNPYIQVTLPVYGIFLTEAAADAYIVANKPYLSRPDVVLAGTDRLPELGTLLECIKTVEE